MLNSRDLLCMHHKSKQLGERACAGESSCHRVAKVNPLQGHMFLVTTQQAAVDFPCKPFQHAMHVQERAAVIEWQNSIHVRLDKQRHDTAAEACQRYMQNADLLKMLCGADKSDTNVEARPLAGANVTLYLSAFQPSYGCYAYTTVTAVCPYQDALLDSFADSAVCKTMALSYNLLPSKSMQWCGLTELHATVACITYVLLCRCQAA